MAVTIVWHGDKILRQIDAKAAVNLASAVSHVVAKVKQNISISSQKGFNRSKPGEFPHAETGVLRNSIRGEVNQKLLRGRIGTNLVYARILELGGIITPKSAGALAFMTPQGNLVLAKSVTIAARPYLRRTLNEEWRKIRRILVAGPKGSKTGRGSGSVRSPGSGRFI